MIFLKAVHVTRCKTEMLCVWPLPLARSSWLWRGSLWSDAAALAAKIAWSPLSLGSVKLRGFPPWSESKLDLRGGGRALYCSCSMLRCAGRVDCRRYSIASWSLSSDSGVSSTGNVWRKCILALFSTWSCHEFRWLLVFCPDETPLLLLLPSWDLEWKSSWEERDWNVSEEERWPRFGSM